MNLKEHIQQHKQQFDDQEMSSEATILFEARLKNELHQPRKVIQMSRRLASIAASVILIITVIVLNQNDVSDSDKKMLLASLTNESAGERLEGVYRFSEEFSKEDEKITKTLLKILTKDPNANVKIATIDALLKFPTNESIRVGLVSALENENTPLVQIKLIKSLSFLRENRAKKPLENIINNTQTFPIVKNNATLAMAHLKQ